MPIALLPLATLVASLLPHLDTLDAELSILFPGRVPFITSFPEIKLRRWAGVDPRLVLETVLEPAIGASDGDVEDQVELLIEWS